MSHTEGKATDRAPLSFLYNHPLLPACLHNENQVVVAARREDKLREVADEIKSAGGEAVVVVGDISKVCRRCHPLLAGRLLLWCMCVIYLLDLVFSAHVFVLAKTRRRSRPNSATPKGGVDY